VRVVGIPLTLLNAILTSFLRGLGDTRTPMFATLIGLVVHVASAWALIFGNLGLPAWGIAGAGAAMVGSQAAYAVVLALHVFRPRMRERYATRAVRPDRALMRRFLWTGAPIGGQWFLDMSSFALFTSIVARMGDAPMAASQAMLQLLSVSFMAASGIGVATGALVGRHIGARRLDAATGSYVAAVKLVLGLAAAVAVLFLTAPEALIGVFTADAEVTALARPLLLLGAAFQVVDALAIVAGGALRGAGDTRWPFIVQALLAWLLRLPLVYLGAVVLAGGVLGAWLGELGYVAALAGVLTLRFRAGRWRSIQI
jgi:MATE family multidrug resistance protein